MDQEFLVERILKMFKKFTSREKLRKKIKKAINRKDWLDFLILFGLISFISIILGLFVGLILRDMSFYSN